MHNLTEERRRQRIAVREARQQVRMALDYQTIITQEHLKLCVEWTEEKEAKGDIDYELEQDNYDDAHASTGEAYAQLRRAILSLAQVMAWLRECQQRKITGGSTIDPEEE